MSDRKSFETAIELNPEDRTTQAVFADWLDENGHPEEARWHRAGAAMTGEEFINSIIAQDDDNDYEESGYVACVVDRNGERFGLLAYYSHCSCYGTWEDLCGGGISDYYAREELKYPRWTWVGTVLELIDMARRKADPVLPQRTISEDDYNADHLLRVYEGIMCWAEGVTA